MIRVVFHKSLLPYTNGNREILMERDSYFFLAQNCINLFPQLEVLVRKQLQSKTDDLAIVCNNSIITKEFMLYLPEEDSVVYLVPIFYGGFESVIGSALLSFALSTTMSLLQGYSVGDALLRGLISGVFSYAGSFIAGPSGLGLGQFGQAVVKGVFSSLGGMIADSVTGPPPRDDKLDSSSRLDNYGFDSITNTTSQDISVALHYGMIRVGGQYISSEIETATDQRFEDLSENENTELLIPSDGNDPGGGQGNLDSPSSISTTDYRGESLTPDQY